MPARRARMMEILDAAMRGHAAGRSASWAVGLGATVQDASRALGVLWNERTPLPNDVRWHAAATFRCESREVATYGALAQRMLRQLPRHLPPGGLGGEAPDARRARSSTARPPADLVDDELAVRARIVDAARWIARDRAVPWATFFGDSVGEGVARLGRIWASEAPVPDAVRASMAHVLECPATEIDTYGRLARRLAHALPRAFDVQHERRPAHVGAPTRGEAPRDMSQDPAVLVSRADAPTTPPADTVATRRPPQPPSRAKSGVRSRSSAGHLRVLVVEANADFALLLGEHLSNEGHRPAIVFTLEQARAMLDASPFDVVLVESSPGGPIDGVDLARRLRAASRAEVVVVMSDHRAPELEAEALQAGASAWLGKPFGREELFSTIQKAVLRAARSGSS